MAAQGIVVPLERVRIPLATPDFLFFVGRELGKKSSAGAHHTTTPEWKILYFAV